MLVSVIIPVLDEHAVLASSLDQLAGLAGTFEVLVADGGSRDGTLGVARFHPLRPRVLTSPPAPTGRGAQLNAAAAEASGDLLLFLHADTRLPAEAYAALAAAHADPLIVGGNFALAFDGLDGLSGALGSLYVGLRRLGIYYGDSAVFVRPEVFAALGGFRDVSIMDDYDFVRRLERAGKTVCLPGPALTSARRWRRDGATRTVATWAVIQALFLAGVPADRLARLYSRAR
jgi:rSAM/selenodomain-associated transferase 2